MCCVLLCMLEVSEVMRCALRFMPEMLDVLDLMRCVLLCMLYVVEGVLCFLEVLELCAACYSVCWTCRR